MKLEQTIKTALSFHESGELSQAISLYQSVIDQNPTHFQALNLIGLAYQQMGRDQEALEVFGVAIQINPNHALPHYSAGSSALKLGQYAQALEHLDTAIAFGPSDAQALINKGIALHKLGFLERARKIYLLAIRVAPEIPTAHFNLGCTLQEMRFTEALELAIQSYEASIALNPQDPLVYNNLGNAFKTKKNYKKGLFAFARAVALNSQIAVSYYNKGTTEFFAKNYTQSARDLKRAVELDPHSSASWNNLGNALKELNLHKDALQAYEQVLSLTTDQPSSETFYNIGIVQHELSLYTQACESYTRALEIDPYYSQALNARAITYRHLKFFDQAIADFKSVLLIDPEFEYALGNLLHTQMHIADWSTWNTYVDPLHHSKLSISSGTDNSTADSKNTLKSQILMGKKASHPFPVLALYDDAELNLKASVIWFKDKHSELNDTETALHPDPITEPAKPLVVNLKTKIEHKTRRKSTRTRTRIRIAYLSADFHNHATAYLIAELLELHNRDEFEIYAVSFGPKTQDAMQTRISSAVNHFIDVSHLNDQEIAELCRSMEIDIAVDLKGYTLQSRFNIFMHRCAPIQVGYLGYPGTSGSNCMDYLIADQICIPKEDKCFYSEKIVFMPHSYQVNDAKRNIKKCLQTKTELGLPVSGFVYCCFNNTYKITPKIFETWMYILSQVERSVIWLLEDSEIITKNLRIAAKSYLIDPDRLVFAKRTELDEHLGRHIHADLFLDTLPYNAHTTASDALWAGLPVLTIKGNSFAGRVASSLLDAIGLSDLITHCNQTYIEKAVHLGKNPNEMTRLKDRLNKSKLSYPLFNTKQFTMDLESAYKLMLDRHYRGTKPDHLEVT